MMDPPTALNRTVTGEMAFIKFGLSRAGARPLLSSVTLRDASSEALAIFMEEQILSALP
jgi:hypothetical protein